jgi:hypothetical protein
MSTGHRLLTNGNAARLATFLFNHGDTNFPMPIRLKIGLFLTSLPSATDSSGRVNSSRKILLAIGGQVARQQLETVSRVGQIDGAGQMVIFVGTQQTLQEGGKGAHEICPFSKCFTSCLAVPCGIKRRYEVLRMRQFVTAASDKAGRLTREVLSGSPACVALRIFLRKLFAPSFFLAV